MKIMAIDYGDAHTGIAISDATGTLAGFSTVINSRRPEVVAQEIAALIPQHGVGELVLGYPKNMDGTLGPRAEKAAAFGETLKELTGLPLTLWRSSSGTSGAPPSTPTTSCSITDRMPESGRKPWMPWRRP